METRSSVATAAVAVLFRRRPRLEVYWVKRNPLLSFLGGFWAFPGGRAEPGDASLRAAAARELFEETGVRMAPHEAIFLDGGRTLTPAWSHIRFDCAYYVVEVPDGIEPDPLHADGELVGGEWIEPARALELWDSGERMTTPIVVRTLRALAAGADGAAERLRELNETSGDADALRLWDITPAFAMAPLRSPTILPATHTNCFVVGTDELVVVDPGSPYPEEQTALDLALEQRAERDGARVREIWITHHHIDHVAGALHLSERWKAPIAAHPRTVDALRGAVRFDRQIEDGETVTLGPRRLRAVFTPGHTAGHHAFLEETTRFILAGDLVAGVGTVIVDPDEGDMIEYLASIDRLKLLEARALLPAHGHVITEPAAKLHEYTRHRLWREERVVEALRAGAGSAAELVPRVYADAPPAVWPLAERSLLAHLVKLVKEGRVDVAAGSYALRRS